jgi:hypothetical protein
MPHDRFMEIGSTHEVCEDYAISGIIRRDSDGDLIYGIVCDGCSGSPDTDVGARVLAKKAVDLLQTGDVPTSLGRATDFLEVLAIESEAIAMSVSGESFYSNNRNMLDSTFMMALSYQGRAIVICEGDGVVCVVGDDGLSMVYRLFVEGARPPYPSYRLSRYGRGRPGVLMQEMISGGERVGAPSECSGGIFFMNVDMDDLRCVAVASDGVESFAVGRTSIPTTRVADELVSFKLVSGKFVKIRMTGLKRSLKKVGEPLVHLDDLSVAAVSRKVRK